MLESGKRPCRLSTRFAVLILALCLALAGLLLGLLSVTQYNQAISETVNKAEALSGELDAIWRFVDTSQELINYDSAGNYEYKGLHCAIAGQSVARAFSSNSDYIIRYVSVSPRNESGRADGLEAKAIGLFEGDSAISHYYELTEYEGEPVMRFVQRLTIEQSCLECHGGPAGETDVTGYAKEGMELGDVGGAISMIMPMGSYLDSIRNNVLFSAVVIGGLMCAGFLVVSLSIKKYVTRPIGELQGMIARVGEGDFASPDFEGQIPTVEIADLAHRFAEMTERLGHYYDDLEQEVGLRTRQLSEANETLRVQHGELQRINDELQQANRIIREESRQKAEFFSYLNHELRTPLTAILAFSEIWMESVRQGRPLDKESFDEIRANCRILLSMVNNNLELLRLESGYLTFSPEPTDIADIVGVSVASVKPLLDKKRVSLDIHMDPGMPLVEIDAEKVRMVMENLLSNAAKYSRMDGSVTVRIGREGLADSEGGGRAEGEGAAPDSASGSASGAALDSAPDSASGAAPDFSLDSAPDFASGAAPDFSLDSAPCPACFFIEVADCGIGIEKDRLDGIFDLFVQGEDSARRRYNGSGVGLCLVSRLVSLHGGTIEVESVVGEGSRFTVRLPISRQGAGVERGAEPGRGVEPGRAAESGRGAEPGCAAEPEGDAEPRRDTELGCAAEPEGEGRKGERS